MRPLDSRVVTLAALAGAEEGALDLAAPINLTIPLRDPSIIGAGGVDVGQGDAGESGDGGEAGGRADKFATRRMDGVHGWVEERRGAGVRGAMFFTRGRRNRLAWRGGKRAV
jgi:hypothetical protein